MKIASSAIQLGAQRAFTERTEKKESLLLFSNGRRQSVQNEGPAPRGATSLLNEAEDELSKQPPAVSLPQGRGGNSLGELVDSMLGGMPGVRAAKGKGKGKKAGKGELDEEVETEPGTKLDLMKQLMEKLLNQKFKISNVKDFQTDPATTGQAPVPGQQAPAQGGQAQGGFGMRYELHEMHYEAERTQFNASGSVKTADGKEISFELNLEMSREYASEKSLIIEAGVIPTDPLVVNYAGNSAELTDAKFQFDLDSDGDEEAVSFLQGGSGFLAFDKNGDGVINNGSELFGPKSGDGFADLRQYDEDANQFIDEGDSIYNKLRLYNKDQNGTDQLDTLQSKGIGAIYLGSTSTEFSLKDEQNVTQGQIRQTGVYLGENGETGTVQQVDLAV